MSDQVQPGETRPIKLTEAEFRAYVDESFTNGAKATVATLRSMLDELERLADVDLGETLKGGSDE